MKRKAKWKPSSIEAQPELISPCWELPTVVGLIVIFAALLLFAARGDYWLDEVLSFQWASAAENPWQLVQIYRHDNNHPLNSFWLMLVGEQKPPIIGRLLSILSGVGALFLMWKIGQIIAPRAAIIPVAVSASSFPLILYFSEARGYAPAIFFSLLCTWLIFSTPKSFDFLRPLCFWLSSCLAILAHGTSIYILAGLGIWWVVRQSMEGLASGFVLKSTLLWFTIPGLVSVCYYFYFLREMIVAGGPELSVATVCGHFFGYALGWGVSGAGAVVSVIIAIALIGLAVLKGKYVHSADRVLFALVLFILPSAGLIFSGAEYLYFRYFLVCLPFFYLLMAPLGAWVLQNGGLAGRWGVAFFLIVFIGSHAPRITDLLIHGRGDYAPALQAVVQGGEFGATLASDHDFRNGLVIHFHRRNSPGVEGIQYQMQNQEGLPAPGWLITHSQEAVKPDAASGIQFYGAEYRLHSSYLAGPVSGFHWFLYQLQSPPEN